MKKHIAEELPARKHPQAQLSSTSSSSQAKSGSTPFQQKGGERPGSGDRSQNEKDSGAKTPEERIRQAVYDIRYRARRENIPLRSAYAQYMQNSSMSEMEKTEVKKKLFGNKEGKMTNEDYNIKSLATESMANALYKVFVENDEYSELSEEYIEELKKTYYKKSSLSTDKKYQVRVTDKNGISYIRMATRKKISELRANPNIQSVEMTEYGEPYEGKKKDGKKDWDGDGKVESGAKEYRGVVHNAIRRTQGKSPNGKDTSNVKEEYLDELMADPSSFDARPVFDIMPKKKKNKVNVNPKCSDLNARGNALMAHHEMEGESIAENGYSRFLEILQEKKMTKKQKSKEKKLKSKYDSSDMKKNMIDQYGEEKGKQIYFATIRNKAMKEEQCGCDDKEKDDRSKETARNLIANKFRSMGVKNPIIISAEQVEPAPPQYKPVTKKEFELQQKRTQAPKGTGIPSQKQGYTSIKP